MQQIRFPRRIQLGFRPWYGLTLRQLFYVAIAAVIAGAAILFLRVDFLIRVLIGLAILSAGIALAFFRKDGMSVEQWIVTWIKFRLHPQRRVWTRGDATAREHQVADIQIDERESDASFPASPTPVMDDAPSRENVRLLRPTPRATAPAASPVVVFIDLAVLLSLFALVVYLMSGGWSDVQGWFGVQFGP